MVLGSTRAGESGTHREKETWVLLGVLCGMLAFGGCGRAQHFPRSPALEDELSRLEGAGRVLEREEVIEGDGVETGSEDGCEVSSFGLGFGLPSPSGGRSSARASASTTASGAME